MPPDHLCRCEPLLDKHMGALPHFRPLLRHLATLTRLPNALRFPNVPSGARGHSTGLGGSGAEQELLRPLSLCFVPPPKTCAILPQCPLPAVKASSFPLWATAKGMGPTVACLA